MTLSVRLMQRDFSDPLNAPPLRYRADRHSWSAIGGPKQAAITARGRAQALWELLEMLRAPVELSDEHGDAVWWGYVSGVLLNVNRVQFGVSLDSMANRVAVAYMARESALSSSNERATTTWVQDDDSVTTYGVKELLQSLSDATVEQAEGLRDTILSQLRYPIPQLEIVEAGVDLSATLTCAGWWETLGWRYYAETGGLEQHWPDASGIDTGQGVGNWGQSQQCAQRFRFTGTTSWFANYAAVWAKRIGTVTDNLIFELYTDSSGNPGSLLTSGFGIGGDINTSWMKVEVELSPQVELQPDTYYWLRLRRSGGLDGNNYIAVKVDEGLGYAPGYFRIWNGTAWIARSPDADLMFKVGGVRETSAQIEAIATAAGQFLTGVDVLTASGVYSSPVRDGDTTALREALDLLESGTSSNKRLLATVLQNRRLKVYQEPDPGVDDYLIVSDGQILTSWDIPVDPQKCPCAVWARLKDVIPASVDVSKLGSPSPIFVEHAEYMTDGNHWLPTPRSVPNTWDIVRLDQG